jgi:hypothetical protein
MQFYTVTDQYSIAHKVLVVSLGETEMGQVVGQCAKCMPSISISAMVQMGHPYVIMDFGGGNGWKTAVALDEESEDGHKIGDELTVGDTLTVILTSKSKAISVSRDKAYINVPLEDILAFSFLYTADMAENYALFKMFRQPKGE